MCARPYAKYFMWIILFNLHYEPHEVGTNILPIFTDGKLVIKRLRDLCKVPHTLNGKTGIQSQDVQLLICAFNHLHIY